MEKKKFTHAPLPFMGQKRRWNGEIKTALKEFEDCDVFIDLFGGSGLLSRIVKDARPDAHVILNDFDNYKERLSHVGSTNALINDIREIVKGVERNKLIDRGRRDAILKRIKEEEKSGFVDYITLSSSLLFSVRYATCYEEMAKETLYNNVRPSDYTTDGYLDGIDVVREDYKTLFGRWTFRKNVCFLIDPPYLFTKAGTYTGNWNLKDYLDVLHTLDGTKYFYFTSNKSNIVELCEWMNRNYQVCNPFEDAVMKKTDTPMNFNSKYVDIMLYKR